MKWVVRRMPNVPLDELVHFELIDLENNDCDDGLETELQGKGFSVWVDFQLDRNFGNKAKRKYETFIGGFLTYYERDHEERKIFFEWCHRGHENYVRIFINPPASLIADPPRPPGPPPPESSE